MATKKKKKVGRKKVEFDWDKFDSILQFKPPKQVCSDILGISEDSIERRIKESTTVPLASTELGVWVQ